MSATAENPFETGTVKTQSDQVAMDAMGVQIAGQRTQVESPLETNEQQAGAPRDAVVRVYQDASRMTAEVLLDEPLNGGAPLTLEQIHKKLAEEGIVYGISEEALQMLVASPVYGQRLPVAFGTAPEDGVDGSCKELFPREHKANYVEREDGTVDYRELGLINDVKSGTIIMEVTPPTPGQDGTNVLGKPMKPREGKKAVIPMGEGCQLTVDGRRVETTVSGNLVFRNGRFTVDRVYRVQDVDYDVGNITFSGDVQVNGDVQDGFEIHAGGDISLRGRVGNVVLQAGGNITIEKGINGTGKALIETPKTLKAGFIENCNLRVGEKVVASSIINSQVECEGEVEVTSGKGIICGGKITCFGSVKANEIGNDFNTLTIVTLGVTPGLLAERKRLTGQLEDVTRHIDEMQKNIAYIERLVADDRPVPPDRIQLLKRSQLQMPLTEKKRDQLQALLVDLEARMAEVNASTLTAKVIHPPTKVSIGALSTNCIETRNMCRVYRSQAGELVFGSY